MKRTAIAGFWVGLAAAVAAAVFTFLIHNDIPASWSLPAVVGGFAAGAGVVAFSLTTLVCSRRINVRQPVLGPARGALVAVATLLLCTVPHAAFFPGAGGILASIFGQSVVATLLFAPIVAVAGAVMGFCLERLVLSRAPETSSLEQKSEG